MESIIKVEWIYFHSLPHSLSLMYTHPHTLTHAFSFNALKKKSYIQVVLWIYDRLIEERKRRGESLQLSQREMIWNTQNKVWSSFLFFYIQIISFLKEKWKELNMVFLAWIYANDDPRNVRSATEFRGCREKLKWSSDIDF